MYPQKIKIWRNGAFIVPTKNRFMVDLSEIEYLLYPQKIKIWTVLGYLLYPQKIKNEFLYPQKIGFSAHFFWPMPIFVLTIGLKSVKFVKKCGHLPTFCPLLKMDLATKNPVFMRVCGLFAHFPTFITYFIYVKNI